MKARAKAAAPKPASTRKAPAKKATAPKKAAKPRSTSKPPEGRRFEPGNMMWEARVTVAPDPLFETPEALWAKCVEYFEWVVSNPLLKTHAFPTKDQVREKELPLMRPMSVRALCFRLRISDEAWRGWKTEGHKLYRPDLVGIIADVETVIYEYKFAGAAAGLLNPNLIARELGLTDKTEVTGKEGGAIQHEHKVRVVKVPLKKPATVQTRPMATPEGEE